MTFEEWWETQKSMRLWDQHFDETCKLLCYRAWNTACIESQKIITEERANLDALYKQQNKTV